MKYFIITILNLIMTKIIYSKLPISNSEESDNLFFIFSNFRHGARTPNKYKSGSNETDYINVTWDDSAGELTKLGIIQQFLIGIKNRKKYNNFLSKKFNPYEILIYSTNLNRTKSSGFSQLIGLYYNNYNLNITDAKNFTPIHFDFEKIDYKNLITYPIPYFIFKEVKRGNILRYEKTFDYDRDINCKKVIPIRNKNKKLDTNYIDFYNDFKLYMQDFLEKNFNFDFSKDKFEQLHRFCDAFISQVTHNKTHELLIKFRNVTETYLRCIEYEKLKLFNIEQGGQSNFTGEMTMSSIMLKIIDYMEYRINNNNRTEIIKNYPKFVLYSTHDTNLASMGRYILSTFNYTISYPYYASNEIFELRKYNNEFYVEFYFDDILGFNISFNEFKSKVLKVSWNDRSIIDYCDSYSKIDFIIIGISFGIVIVCLVIFTFVLLIFKYDNKGEFLYMNNNDSNSIVPNE